MIITVERPVAQHLHVNPRPVNTLDLNSPEAWSVRITGDFMIVMNNLTTLPVIVRHPQRFNDSRSFVAAFKQEFLHLLELAPIPHSKIRMIRDAQFRDVRFTGRVADESIPVHLQTYQNILTGPNSTIDWDRHPTNAELALQIAELTVIHDPAEDTAATVISLFENYVMENFALPAHPTLNEHNRNYLYRSASLNDVMNAVAVGEHLLSDYQQYLENRGKSDQAIDRDLDTADDYLSFCDGYDETIFDDLTLVYNYLIHYEKLSGVKLTDIQLKEKGAALRELGRFMRYQQLFSAADFDHFVQAIGQGIKDLHSPTRNYYFHRLLQSVQEQRDAFTAARHYARKRYKLTVTLDDYQPVMWRQFSFGGDTRLDILCYQILASFKASGSHLFVLQAPQHSYQLPVFNSGLGSSESLLVHWLGEFQLKDELLLVYDFGDRWVFRIKIDAVIRQSRLRTLNAPQLLAGSGRGIIDDIGGVAGLIEAAKDAPDLDLPLKVSQEQKEWAKAFERLRQNYYE